MANMTGTITSSRIYPLPNGGAKQLAITIIVDVGDNAITLVDAGRGPSHALDAPAEVAGLTGRAASIVVVGGAITAVAIT